MIAVLEATPDESLSAVETTTRRALVLISPMLDSTDEWRAVPIPDPICFICRGPCPRTLCEDCGTGSDWKSIPVSEALNATGNCFNRCNFLSQVTE
jgi:hypothetical protein